jgi:hypothetical protein
MKTTTVVAVNVVGDVTGRAYSGNFTIKSVLSMRDEFTADLRRRQIIGPSPENTPPAATLQWRAYMYGQVTARATETPKFWSDADGGLELPDSNVVAAVYEEILKAEAEFKEAIAADSKKALEKLVKKSPKKKAEEVETDDE